MILFSVYLLILYGMLSIVHIFKCDSGI